MTGTAIAKRTKTDRTATLNSLLKVVDESLVNRTKLAGLLEQHQTGIIEALIDCALGVRVETEEVTKAGLVQRVYQKAPNVGAVTKLLEITNCDVIASTSAFLAFAKAESELQEIESGIFSAKRDNLTELTEFARSQRKVFIDAQITEEEFQGALIKMAFECLQIMMAVHFEDMKHYVATEDAYQLYQVAQKDRLKMALKRVLNMNHVEDEDTVEEAG